MTWLGWQIDYLLLLQDFRHITHDKLDSLFLFISNLGIMPFTLVLMCVIYWGLNKKLGLYMIYCNCFSLLMNMFLKLSFCIYRPWILDARIQPPAEAFTTADGYSFPSGHTAGAVSVWGSIAMYFKNKKIVTSLCVLMIFFIMLSRNYLGVHTPQDVIVSLIVGIFILFGVQKLLNKIEQDSKTGKIFLIVITIICILLGMYIMLKSYPADYKDGLLLYDPTHTKLSSIGNIVTIFAIFSGSFLERKFVNFEPIKNNIFKSIIVVVFGIVLLLFIKNYLTSILTTFIDHQYAKYIVRFIQGLFLTFLYPCFIKFISNLGK